MEAARPVRGPFSPCALSVCSAFAHAAFFPPTSSCRIQVGLDYNKNTETIDRTKVYESGRYLLGLGHEFIKFPRVVQTIRFSGSGNLPVRTYDGLLITLEVSFQYRLRSTLTDLLELYETYGTNYAVVFTKIARDAVRDIASDFAAYDFFTNRTFIQNTMQDELVRVMDLEHAQVESFQLLDVALPVALDEAIQRTQISRQGIQEALFRLSSAQIDADTRVLKAEKDAEIIVVSANATAASLISQANAEAAATIASFTAEGTAYSQLQTTAGFTPEETLAYFFTSAVRESAARLFIGVNQPSSNKLP